ncbi:MAG TPA: bifunctional phosphoglucose/phosphomannose isomerase [Firmicutes bacterium]|nr:bifunctional phosphoglucose/phosphomannose isomerase [Bacillota bacterium]
MIQAHINLDDVEAMKKADPRGMLGFIQGLPEQCQEAWEIASRVDVPGGFAAARNIVVAGLGGSAIGGDLLRTLVASELNIPVVVSRDYELPGFVDRDSLVVASSYSGNTEETISSYLAARAKGAKILCITSGGKLAELAADDGVPVIKIPGTLVPRAALGYLFIPMIVVLGKLGLIRDKAGDLAEAVDVLAELRRVLGPESPEHVNQSKRLAAKMLNKIPVIYGSSGWPGTAALRWKCQINENSKTYAVSNIFPEMNHNETVGWGAPGDIAGQLYVVLLRDKGDHPRVQKRMEITKSLMSSASGIDEVWSTGKSELARLLSLIYVGDFASAYLAFLYGVDPTPVAAIDYLKGELAKVK